jgi:nitrate reductase NapD
MVVSGLLINTLPEKLEEVKKQLSTMTGVEINTIIDGYKIVAVVESKTIEEEISISKQIAKMDGVLSISLAYHHFEEDETNQD